MHDCDILPNRDGEEQQDLDWIQFSIAKDVGKSENTIKEAVKMLRSMNHLRDGPRKKTPDECCKKLLRLITASTSHAIGTEASRELEATQGLSGQPGIRMFQQAAPMGAPVGRTRHLPRLVAYFHDGCDGSRRSRWGTS